MGPKAIRNFIEAMHKLGASRVEYAGVVVEFREPAITPEQLQLALQEPRKRERVAPEDEENDELRVLLASTDEMFDA